MSQNEIRRLVFAGPGRVEVERAPLAEPAEGMVLLECEASAISAGTELLVYRGNLAAGIDLDESLDALSGDFEYPLRYGYACAGCILRVGDGVSGELVGRRAFVFHPHASRLVVKEEDLVLVPENLSSELACLLPTVETAVNLCLDASPQIGERSVVVGQGMVGLCLTAILARFPLDALWTIEPDPFRRDLSEQLGAERSLSPSEVMESNAPVEAFLSRFGTPRADLCFELSSRGAGLEQAIALCGLESRLIVGSWYGDAPFRVKLGTHFHRNRIHLVSSQVSRLAPRHSGRFTKKRRLDFAMNLLPELGLEPLITHRFPIENAPDAYRLLANAGEEKKLERVGQVIFTYEEDDT